MKTLSFPLFMLSMLSVITGCHQPGHGIVRSDFCYLLAGTYTQSGYTLQGVDSGIYILQMNTLTGELSMVNSSPATENPSFLVYDPSRQQVFAVNENEHGAISALALDTSMMTLRFLNQVSSEGKYPCYISLAFAGQFVLAANYGSGNVAVFPISPDGKIEQASSLHQHAGKGPDTARQEGPHAHMIIPSPDGKYVYSTDLGTDEIYVYALDPEKKSLNPASFTVKTSPGAGPRHLAFYSGKPWVYVINELNGTIETFHYNEDSGILERFQIAETREQGDTRFAGCADIHIHPSGKFLYASNRGEINSIVLFDINPATGLLTRKESFSAGGQTPRNFAISLDGNFLLAANQKSNNICVFRIDPETGKLTATGHSLAVPAPVCLKFIP